MKFIEYFTQKFTNNNSGKIWDIKKGLNIKAEIDKLAKSISDDKLEDVKVGDGFKMMESVNPKMAKDTLLATIENLLSDIANEQINQKTQNERAFNIKEFYQGRIFGYTFDDLASQKGKMNYTAAKNIIPVDFNPDAQPEIEVKPKNKETKIDIKPQIDNEIKIEKEVKSQDITIKNTKKVKIAKVDDVKVEKIDENSKKEIHISVDKNGESNDSIEQMFELNRSDMDTSDVFSFTDDLGFERQHYKEEIPTYVDYLKNMLLPVSDEIDGGVRKQPKLLNLEMANRREKFTNIATSLLEGELEFKDFSCEKDTVTRYNANKILASNGDVTAQEDMLRVQNEVLDALGTKLSRELFKELQVENGGKYQPKEQFDFNKYLDDGILFGQKELDMIDDKYDFSNDNADFDDSDISYDDINDINGEIDVLDFEEGLNLGDDDQDIQIDKNDKEMFRDVVDEEETEKDVIGKDIKFKGDEVFDYNKQEAISVDTRFAKADIIFNDVFKAKDVGDLKFRFDKEFGIAENLVAPGEHEAYLKQKSNPTAMTESDTLNAERYKQNTFGNLPGIVNMTTGLACYNKAKEIYDGHGIFGKFFGLFTGRTQKERAFIKQVENVFDENGINKEQLAEMSGSKEVIKQSVKNMYESGQLENHGTRFANRKKSKDGLGKIDVAKLHNNQKELVEDLENEINGNDVTIRRNTSKIVIDNSLDKAPVKKGKKSQLD